MQLDEESPYVFRINLDTPDLKNSTNEHIVAVVVTISTGESYDSMFSDIPQIAPDGVVAVYKMNPQFLPFVHQQLLGTLETVPKQHQHVFEELFDNILSIDSNCVVFNWECCTGCSSDGFEYYQETVRLMKTLLENKFIVMCSDFSVLALNHSWDPELLGPNPLIIVGEIENNFEISFQSDVLLNCPSVQLQKLADLCDDGSDVHLRASGGTTVFTVDQHIIETTNAYEFSLLTIATTFDGISARRFSIEQTKKKGISLKHRPHRLELGDLKGFVGHCMFKFPSGGILLLSTGHWIELLKLNASEENVLRVASSLYSPQLVDSWRNALSLAVTPSHKTEMLSSYCAQIIQNSTPGNYVNSC